MSKPEIKVGMIGAGYILKSHALAVGALENTCLHAVADSSAQRAADGARQFGFAHSFSSVEEIAASDCDVVHVLVPPHLHLDFAERLLESGKSVFLEKPMGLFSKDCARIGELAESKGLRLGVNHNFLFLPGYERLRQAITEQDLGRIDHITCNWNAFLPQLRSGPFDAWMLSAPANLFFELGPHVAAFILDLLTDGAIDSAVAASPIDLPSGQQAYRSWSALGHHGLASFTLSISVNPGHSDKVLRVRASSGSAQLDFGRDIYWSERTEASNPIFDAHAVGRGIARQIASTASRERLRRLVAALRKSPENSPYSESIFRSVARFYDSARGVDPRHHWAFAAKTIQFCEQVCVAAGVGSPSPKPISIAGTIPKLNLAPKILVVGGTGFIGRRLVAKLIEKGAPVRVLSRGKRSAAIAFRDLPIDIHEGFHGNREVARKALEGIETVYHLAKSDGQKWEDYVQGDVEPTRVLAEEAVAAGVKRFIYTGTIDSYDSSRAAARITGDTPLDPKIRTRNLYARSKAACEAVLDELSRTKGLPLVVMRPGIVIGAGADPAHIGVANFASEGDVRYWGDGNNKLPLVLVEDVANALVRAAEAPNAIGRRFLLTSSPQLSARDYVAAFGDRANVKIRARPRSAWRDWAADFIKEAVKHVIRHPNRRSSSLHDWRCRSHRSVYDSSSTREALGWNPIDDRDTLIELGIGIAVDAALGDRSAAGTVSEPRRRSARAHA